MARFSLSSLSKLLLLIFIITFILFIYNLPLIFEEQFLDLKELLKKSLEQSLLKDVDIEKIGFLPHGELILYNIKIYDRESDIYYGIAKRCHINFKILPLILNRTLIVTSVVFKEPIVFLPSKKVVFPTEERARISDYKLEFDKHFLIKVIEGRALFARSNYASGELGFSGWGRRYGEEGILSEGCINLEDYKLKDYILNDLFFFTFVNKIAYRVKISFHGDRMSVDNVLLDFQQFKIEGDGVIENYKDDPRLDLNLSLKELDLPRKAYLRSRLLIESIRNFIVNIKGTFGEPSWSIRMDELRSRFASLPAVLTVDNFYCRLNISRERLSIEECSGFFNNFPVGVKFLISTDSSPSISLDVISYPGQVPSLKPFNPLNFEFSFSGDRVGDSISGSLGLYAERLLSAESRLTRDLRLSIGQIRCNFLEKLKPSSDGNNIPLSVEAADVLYEARAPSQDLNLRLENINASLRPENGKLYLTDLKVSGYRGLLEGEGMLEFGRARPDAYLDFKFRDFSMDELVDIIDLDYELSGGVNGRAVFNTRTFFFLNGDLDISNGHIGNIEMLDLIADFLGIPSLKDIYFDSLSSGFSISKNTEEISFRDIKLRSKDINMDADLELEELVKIKGDAMVRLSPALLKESFKMRLLFLLIGERIPYADFDFKIAGFLRTPRIKWLDTRFRKSVMRFLSEGGQKAMEAQVEEAIKPLLGN